MKKPVIDVISTVVDLEKQIAKMEDIKNNPLYQSSTGREEKYELNQLLNKRKEQLLNIMKKAALSDCMIDI